MSAIISGFAPVTDASAWRGAGLADVHDGIPERLPVAAAPMPPG
jgi:hypothetical protein